MKTKDTLDHVRDTTKYLNKNKPILGFSKKYFLHKMEPSGDSYFAIVPEENREDWNKFIAAREEEYYNASWERRQERELPLPKYARYIELDEFSFYLDDQMVETY